MEVLKPTTEPITEILEAMRQDFINANGYIPTEEDAIRLTDEARAEIRAEKEQRKCE